MQTQASSKPKINETQWGAFYRQSRNRFVSFWLQYLQDHETEHDLLDEDEDNIKTAWILAAKQEQELELLGAMEPLYQFYLTRGRINEGQELFTSSVTYLTNSENYISNLPLSKQKLYGRLLSYQAWFSNQLIQYELAEKLANQALIIVNRIGDKKYIAFLHTIKGHVAFYQHGNAKECHKHFSYSYELYKEIGDQKDIVICLSHLGVSYILTGNYEAAVQVSQEAISICQKQGKNYNASLARCLHNLGGALEGLKQLREANNAYLKCFEICDQLQNKVGMAFALSSQCQIAFKQHRFLEAKELSQQQLIISRSIDHDHLITTGLANLGNAYYVLEEFSYAWESLQESLKIAVTTETKPNIAHTIAQISHLLYHLDEHILSFSFLTVIQPFLLPYRHQGNPENLHEILVTKLPPETAKAIQAEWEGKELDDAVRLIQNYAENHNSKND